MIILQRTASRMAASFILLVSTGLLVSAQDVVQEKDLIAILESAGSAPQDKALTCKRLAIYGTKDAVPAIAKLLPDKELSSWARIALEAIPDQEAVDALRAGLSQTEGRLLIGVINSVAVRKDVDAVDDLAKHLSADDTQVASAAGVALGRIGGDSASKILKGALKDERADVRSAIAEGCVLAAEQWLESGKLEEAAEFYDTVRNADVPKQRVIEATRGLILSRGANGIPLLVEQIRSDDQLMFALGLQTAREIEGAAVTKALAGELANADPKRQALLVFALADRTDEAVLPTVLRAATTGTVKVRMAAMNVLKEVGNVTCVSPLLEIACENDGELAEAARQTLQALPGDDVDADVVSRLRSASGKQKQAIIDVIGLRRIDAVAELITAIDDADESIRSSALVALGETVGPDKLSVLISRVASNNDKEAAIALKALRSAAVRMPDRDACASLLQSALSKNALPIRAKLLEIIGSVGGTKSLQIVGDAAAGNQPLLQDTASQLLGKWMTTDAAPVLLELAKTSRENKYRVRALRGYIRLVRQFPFPAKQRAEMCRAAYKAASREQEKQLVLQVLQRYPNVNTFHVAAELRNDKSISDDANRVLLAIAQKIGGRTDLQELLASIGQKPMKVEIIKAEYGAGDKMKDVTAQLRENSADLPFVTLPSPSYNQSFGGDPAPGIPKKLNIQYRINGAEGKTSLQENAVIVLPMPKT